VSFSKILVGSVVLGAIASGPACADTLVSVRPGVACTSADALARLTRHDGSSRSAPPDATADAREIARRGGCFPFRRGMTVVPHAIRRQTSIVTADAMDRTGPVTVYVANIDFEWTAGPAGHGAGPLALQPPPVVPPATVPGPADTPRSLSTGLLSLGMTPGDARRRFSSAYVVSGLAGSGPGRDDAFVAETRDGSERYEVRSRAGTVIRVTHATQFKRGHQQVLSRLVDRLLAQYGTGPTLVTLPGAAAGADVPSMPPQPGWQHDWIGRPVVMAPRDSLQDATGTIDDPARCAQQMAQLDPSDAGGGSTGDGRPVPAAPGPDTSSCGRQVLVRLEPGTIPSVAGRLLVILADQSAGPDAAPSVP